ncbi:MAG TPA: pitrilysin family protein [Caldimonas sp.]|nr:pitrilysin family protein [Caldimonas sp.]
MTRARVVRVGLARVARAGAALLVAATLPGCATTAPPTGDATGATTTTQAATPIDLKVPRIAFRERRLGNGLQVISVQSHASPTVAIEVSYHVGGRDDPPGRSGFAHLFEHMMFKSTKYMPAEQFDRMTEDVGGSNNASTGDDVTEYHEVVPSNHLETLLWAEAERMQNLKVDQGNFTSERAVVEEEYRQRILASPYGRFFSAVTSRPYLHSPYQRPTIGSIADLDAATLADVAAFHSLHYRPDNATLVVSGDFDQRQLDAWVDKYFGPIPRPAEPLPARHADEPPWTSDRTIEVTAPRVPLPATALVWLGPTVTSADAPALEVAAAILSGGDSSRLNQALVYRQQIAAQAGFSADLRVGPGLLVASAIAAGGKPIDAVRGALLAEVLRLADAPPSSAEIDKVKNQLITDAFASRQTPMGLASAIADAAVLEGDANRVNTDLADLQRVTPADVQRVMHRYVVGRHKVVLDYRQEGSPK